MYKTVESMRVNIDYFIKYLHRFPLIKTTDFGSLDGNNYFQKQFQVVSTEKGRINSVLW